MSSHPHSTTAGRATIRYFTTGSTTVGAAAARRPASSVLPGRRAGRGDARWSQIAAALVSLRAQRRRAVRIVDADCACGAVLIEAATYARSLGFTAIEGRGIDGSPTMIGRARAAANRLRDHAIGLEFDLVDMIHALAQETDFPADIVLWHGSDTGDIRPGTAAALAAAGNLVIGDHASAATDGNAA